MKRDIGMALSSKKERNKEWLFRKPHRTTVRETGFTKPGQLEAIVE